MSLKNNNTLLKRDWYYYLLSTSINGSISSLFNRLKLHYNDFSRIENSLLFQRVVEKKPIYAFDIFDTILRRRIDPPNLIKSRTADYLSGLLSANKIYASPSEILQARQKVEFTLMHRAFRADKDAQYSLKDIVKEILRAVDLSGKIDIQQILDYELDLEKSATDLMPGITKLLDRIRDSGGRIIAISETYFSEEQLRALLKYHNILDYFQELYVSCDIGLSKNTGRLYRYVVQKNEVPILYIGDNYMLDYYIPKKYGISAFWLHNKAEKKRKRNLQKQYKTGNIITYFNAVIEYPHKERGLYDIGYSVLGPALTAFVYTVAKKAKEEDIDSLYFVARDGYTLKKIYDSLKSTIYKNSTIPTSKYLLISRTVVKSSCIKELRKEEIDEYLLNSSDNKNVTFSKILSSYNLTPSNFDQVCREHEINLFADIQMALSNPNFAKLLGSTIFKKTVTKEILKNRELFIKYLKGLGFFNDHKIAFVDFSGEGVSTSLLRDTLQNEKGCPEIYGYYFNLFNRGSKVNLKNVEGVVFDWRKISKYWTRPFLSSFACMGEFFTHPNHGVTIGYRSINNSAKPILQRTPSENEYESVRQVYHGMIKYAEEFGRYYHLCNSDDIKLLNDCRVLIRKWITSAPIKDVKLLQKLYTTNDWPEQKTIYFCNSLKFSDFMSFKRAIYKVETSLWPQGTLQLSHVPGMTALYNVAMRWAPKTIQVIKSRSRL